MRPLLLVLALSVLSASCRRGGGEEEEAWVFPSRLDDAGRVVLTEPQEEALGLERVAAEQGELDVHVTRYGTLSARPTESFWVTAPVAGTLGPPRVQLGDVVEASAELVELEPSIGTAASADLVLRARQIDGEVNSSKARIGALLSEAERMRGLVADKLATLAERDRAEAEVKSEQAHLAALEKSKAELAGNAPHALELVAPTRGRLISFDVEPGQAVDAGAPIARFLTPGPRWLDLVVPSDEAPGATYAIEGASRATEVRLKFSGLTSNFDGLRRDKLVVTGADEAGLLIGSTLAVRVSRPVRGMLLPETALVRRGTQDLVFVEGPAQHFRAEPVKVLGEAEGSIAVTGAIKVGEAVATTGSSSLFAELQLGTPGL